MTDSNERPIFIVGAARSGTTLLRFMLLGNPRIYIPPQSDFIPRLFGRQPTATLSRQQAIRAAEFIFNAHPFIKDWRDERLAAEAFVDSLPDQRPGTLLNTLYSQYAHQYGAERWGDKSPTYTGYIHLMSEIFPDAQFIHIIRDGRDVALSTVETFQKDFHIDLYFAASSWDRRVRAAMTTGRKLGVNRYREIRYEQLVNDPERVLEETCAFLGETFHPAMLEPQKQAHDRLSPKGVHAAVRQPLTTSRVGRWHQEMSDADRRLFQLVAGDTLDELGYDSCAAGNMSLGEYARYAGLRLKYVVLEGGRQILQPTGLFNPH